MAWTAWLATAGSAALRRASTSGERVSAAARSTAGLEACSSVMRARRSCGPLGRWQAAVLAPGCAQGTKNVRSLTHRGQETNLPEAAWLVHDRSSPFPYPGLDQAESADR